MLARFLAVSKTGLQHKDEPVGSIFPFSALLLADMQRKIFESGFVPAMLRLCGVHDSIPVSQGGILQLDCYRWSSLYNWAIFHANRGEETTEKRASSQASVGYRDHMFVFRKLLRMER